MLKRFKIIVITSMLLGIITTYATAWLALWYTNLIIIDIQSDEWFVGNSNWVAIVIKHCTRETMAFTSIRSTATAAEPVDHRIPQWCTTGILPDTTSSNTALSITENALGWPYLSVWGKIDKVTNINNNKKIVKYHGYLPVIHIPYTPLWKGFLLNILFYTLIWICILKIPTSIRYRKRTKHNLCIICKYDLRATPELICPECGNDQNKLITQAKIINKYMYLIITTLICLIAAVTIHHIN